MTGWREPDVEKAVTSNLVAATNARAAGEMLSGLRSKWRAEALTEAADVAVRFTERWPDMDAMKAAGIIGPFTAFGRLADELREMAGKDTGGTPAGESTQPAPQTSAAELLALATVLEIPRPNTSIPFQLRRSHGHADRWAICDRTGRRWYRDLGWMYEPADDRLCNAGRFTLAEAVPLAREIAATEGEVSRG